MSYLRYATPIFLALCLIIATAGVYQLREELVELAHLDLGALSLAVITQALIMFIVIFSWFKNLGFQGVGGVSLFESAAHVGISGLGKYLPGKVAGAVVRGAVVYQKTGNAQRVIMASLIEQIALLHSGVVIGLVLTCYKLFGLWWALIGSVMLLCSLILIKHLKAIVHWVAAFVKKSEHLDFDENRNTSVFQYSIIFTFFSATWWCTGLVMYHCISASGMATQVDFFDVLLITTLGFFGGFLAAFAPAGVGVREGLMISMLTPLIGLPTAVSASILHRAISIAFDLGLGGGALILQRETYMK
ncbi:MAG: flippase-like domain-containing protein [Gammaproteobacteria bacterium]|nr:flippase-like domain-containing protein [Gammaproteobacteria bacterium]